MIVSVGYEGREVEQFARELRQEGVAVVADVRMRASSRRRGFAKSALAEALARQGIDYRHLRALGNPPENRADFHGGDLERGRAVYRAMLETPAARADLDILRELDGDGVVAVLCMEADESRCHRLVVIETLRGRGQ